MNVILWIVFGAIAGWVASMVTACNHGVVEDVVLGVIGAFVGGFIMNFFGQAGVTGFNLYSVVVAVLGAAVLIVLGRALHK